MKNVYDCDFIMVAQFLLSGGATEPLAPLSGWNLKNERLNRECWFETRVSLKAASMRVNQNFLACGKPGLDSFFPDSYNGVTPYLHSDSSLDRAT